MVKKYNGCWVCEREKEDYYLSEYSIEITDPHHTLLGLKVEHVCQGCIDKVRVKIEEFFKGGESHGMSRY